MKFVTHDLLGAGKHHLNTKSWGKIILSQDLSNLESATSPTHCCNQKSTRQTWRIKNKCLHPPFIKVSSNSIYVTLLMKGNNTTPSRFMHKSRCSIPQFALRQERTPPSERYHLGTHHYPLLGVGQGCLLLPCGRISTTSDHPLQRVCQQGYSWALVIHCLVFAKIHQK